MILSVILLRANFSSGVKSLLTTLSAVGWLLLHARRTAAGAAAWRWIGMARRGTYPLVFGNFDEATSARQHLALGDGCVTIIDELSNA